MSRKPKEPVNLGRSVTFNELKDHVFGHKNKAKYKYLPVDWKQNGNKPLTLRELSKVKGFSTYDIIDTLQAIRMREPDGDDTLLLGLSKAVKAAAEEKGSLSPYWNEYYYYDVYMVLAYSGLSPEEKLELILVWGDCT